MNCKQGDIAEVVGIRDPKNKFLLGLRVVCVAPARHPKTGEAGWRIDRKIRGFSSLVDSCLKPINPEGEQDEVLRRVGLPQKTKEKVHEKA